MTNVDTSPEASNISSKALTLSTGGKIMPIVPQNMDEAWRLGQAVVRSGMAPRGLDTPDKCTIAIIAGMEVGLLPMQALQSIAVIGGRPSLFGDGALAVVRKSGLMESIRESYRDVAAMAVCTVKRVGERPITRTFSREDATTAGLWDRKNRDGSPTPWQLYPRRMLAMRARSWAMRDAFADALRGMAIAEEQGDVIEGTIASTGGPPAMEEPEVLQSTSQAPLEHRAEPPITTAQDTIPADEAEAAAEALAEHEAELAEAKRAAQVAPQPEDEDDGLGIPVGLRRTR